jgi:hypothetical protein
MEISRFLYPTWMHPGRICRCNESDKLGKGVIKGHHGPGVEAGSRDRALCVSRNF